jgi:hypothetical protein
MLNIFAADETESVSMKSLALTRYRRNHEVMNEVFMHAAFGVCFWQSCFYC